MKIVRIEDFKGPLQYGELTSEELAEAYRLGREAFTAADLQKYTELDDDDVPVEEVLREMEEDQERYDAERSAHE